MDINRLFLMFFFFFSYIAHTNMYLIMKCQNLRFVFVTEKKKKIIEMY